MHGSAGSVRCEPQYEMVLSATVGGDSGLRRAREWDTYHRLKEEDDESSEAPVQLENEESSDHEVTDRDAPATPL